MVTDVYVIFSYSLDIFKRLFTDKAKVTTMCFGVYNIYKHKMYGNTSMKAERREMEVCCHKAIFLYMISYTMSYDVQVCYKF